MRKSDVWQIILLISILMLVCGSCTTQDAKDLVDIKWVLKSYGEPGNPKELVKDTRITAEFIGSEEVIKGSSGCNSYSGNYEVKGGELTIPGPIAVTEMYCMEPEGVMEQEKQYLEILKAAGSYSVQDGELRINCGNQVLNYTTE